MAEDLEDIARDHYRQIEHVKPRKIPEGLSTPLLSAIDVAKRGNLQPVVIIHKDSSFGVADGKALEHLNVASCDNEQRAPREVGNWGSKKSYPATVKPPFNCKTDY